MGKKEKRVTQVGLVTKTSESETKSLVVQELNIMSADRTTKDIGTFKNALQSAESIYHPNRSLLYDLYSHILLDGHLNGIINKRIEFVLNKRLYFCDREGKRVHEMDRVINSLTFHSLIEKMMETIFWGTTGFDFIPAKELTFEDIPRKHIKPEKKIISIEQNGDEGLNYDQLSNVWVLGETKDLGLLINCAPYAIWKSGNMADWAQYIEIFGQPIRILYYDAYDTKTKIELRRVLDESGSSLAMMIPKQAQFEMKDGKGSTNANGELQDKFSTACNNEMSVLILGNTETTTSSSSSGYAQSKEHGKQQLEKTKSDLRYVLGHLNSEKFLRILKSYGLPVEGGCFEYEKETDLSELKSRLDIDLKVSEKIPVDDDYWYKTYGIPKPDNYEQVRARMNKTKALSMNQKAMIDSNHWKGIKKTLSDFFD